MISPRLRLPIRWEYIKLRRDHAIDIQIEYTNVLGATSYQRLSQAFFSGVSFTNLVAIF